jgi:hypothetical protein
LTEQLSEQKKTIEKNEKTHETLQYTIDSLKQQLSAKESALLNSQRELENIKAKQESDFQQNLSQLSNKFDL